MNAKEIARQLELIKYFTLKKSPIYLNINADVDLNEEIINEYVELSGNFSFTFESIIVDYAKSYSSNLKEKTLQIFFYKKPNENSDSFELIDDPNGLMTPAIINDYIKGELNFKRYIFPSMYNYQTFSEWYSDTAMDIDERDTRSYAMNIIVEESSSEAFESFLNETYSQWKSRFNIAKAIAMEGNFYWFSLYDPRIYEYELSFEDRIAILNYMVYSLNWLIIIDGIDGINGVDEYELFESLIKNISMNDGERLYKYMFEVSGEKTNLQNYEDKLPPKLYEILLYKLIKYFYSTQEIDELFNNFNKERFFAIGFESDTRDGGKQYFDLDGNDKPHVEIITKLGVEYQLNVDEKNSKIHVKSAIQYQYITESITPRIEYRKSPFIGDGTTFLNFNDIIYISPYFINKPFKGLNISYGCVIPIPAFALKWLVGQNDDIKDITNLIGELAVAAAIIFPIFSIAEGSSVIYNSIGLIFTVTSSFLGGGIQEQIKKYDKAKSTPGHPYTKGQNFLNFYYLVSSIYGGIGLKNAISGADNKIKALLEVENLLSSYSVISDFKSYMSPNENLDSFNLIIENMANLQKEYNKFKYLKNQN